jgi:hypothetical protein
MDEEVLSLCGSSLRGNLREGPFTGDHEVRLWKWTSVSIGAPLFGEHRGGISCPVAFERRDKSLYLGEFL